MKRLIIIAMLLVACVTGASATVLFPHFVDIAPDYEEGSTAELEAAGVECVMYHSLKPGFMASNFTEVESFYKDTLPSDVERTERVVGDNTLVIYSSVNKPADTIDTGEFKSVIYVLKRPDNSFVAGYWEQKL